ncbi:MAG: hypothetical protein VB140_04755 [Burkholderia sp.]
MRTSEVRNPFVSPEIMPVDAIASSHSIYATTPMRCIGLGRSLATVPGRVGVINRIGGPRSSAIRSYRLKLSMPCVFTFDLYARTSFDDQVPRSVPRNSGGDEQLLQFA